MSCVRVSVGSAAKDVTAALGVDAYSLVRARIFGSNMNNKLGQALLRATLALSLGVSAPAALADTAAASRYYEDGLTRYQKQDVAGAVIQLKNALQQDRSMLAAHLLLAHAYLQQGDIGPAEVEFSEALRLGVNRAEVAVPLARIYLLQGRPGKLIEGVPADGLPPGLRLEILTLRGTAYAALDRRAEAERSFADARAIDPASPIPLVGEVPMLIAAGRMDLARERAAKAVQLGPSNAGAYNVRASVAHATGDIAAALKDYERAIELVPGFVDARIARAGILVDIGRDAEARTDLESIAKGGPLEPRASYLLALLASRRGDAAEAARRLEEAARLVDSLPAEWIAGHEPLLMVGALAHHAGRQYEKARKYLDTLVARYPRNLGARKLLASIYIDTNEQARATSLLEQVLRAQPDDAQAQTLLGRVYLAQKRYARATELLEKAAQSGDARALASLGASRLGQGETAAATKSLFAAFDKTPGDLGLAITLSNTLKRQGDTKRALDVAQRASAALPGNPAALNLLGAIKGASGDLRGARAAYGEALKRDGGFRPAQLNLARLDVAESRFDDARRTYAELLRKDKRDATVMYESGLLEQRAGKPVDAMRWFEKAVAESPSDVRMGLALIEVKAAIGDRPGALEAAKALWARRANDLSVLAAFAQAQIDSGDSKAAQQTLREMTKLAEFDTDALVRIGYLEISAGHPSGAAYAAQKALQGRPGDLRALTLAAEAALLTGEADKAAEWGNELKARHPSSAEGHRIAGEVALLRKQFPAAADHFRAAFERQPTTALLLSRVGLFAMQGNPAGGMPLLQDWLKSHDRDIDARKALAELHMRAGDWRAARREYETLVGRDVRDPRVFNNFANVLLEQKDPKAVEVARQAQALDPRSPNILDTLGWALASAGQADEATAVLREARLRDPENAEIRFHLASVLAAKGRAEEARGELRPFLERFDREKLDGDKLRLIRSLGF